MAQENEWDSVEEVARNAQTVDFQAPVYQNPLSGQSPFHVHCSGCNGGSFGAHWHGEVEIIYLLPGSQPREMYVENQVYVLHEREAIFIGSGEVHALVDRTADVRALVLEMGFSLLGADFEFFARHRFAEPILRFHEAIPEKLMELEEVLLEIAHLASDKEWGGGKSDTRQGAILRMQVVSCLFRVAAMLTEHVPMVEISGQKAKQIQAMLTVQPVLSYVREYYARPISLEYAAAMAGYEKTRFCQLFKRAVGVSFHQYLTGCRTSAARSMLRETELPISAIAEAVGISQAKTFSRVIREAYGKSPRELREEEKQRKQSEKEN